MSLLSLFQNWWNPIWICIFYSPVLSALPFRANYLSRRWLICRYYLSNFFRLSRYVTFMTSSKYNTLTCFRFHLVKCSNITLYNLYSDNCSYFLLSRFPFDKDRYHYTNRYDKPGSFLAGLYCVESYGQWTLTLPWQIGATKMSKITLLRVYL